MTKLADCSVKAALTALAVAATVSGMTAAAFPGLAAADRVPAAVDQYIENAPPNLGGGGGKGFHGHGSGGSPSTPGTDTAETTPGVAPPATPGAVSARSSTPAGYSDRPDRIERGAAQLPLIGYPATPFLILLLALAAMVALLGLARWIGSRRRLIKVDGHG